MKKRYKLVAIAFAVVDTETNMRVLGPFEGKDCKKIAEQRRDYLERLRKPKGAR